MNPEDNIRVLRRRRPADVPPENVFELLDWERQRELEAWHERRKNRVPAQGKTKTAVLNEGNRGRTWARRQEHLAPRPGKNDT